MLAPEKREESPAWSRSVGVHDLQGRLDRRLLCARRWSSRNSHRPCCATTWSGELESLKRFKDDVKEVKFGYEWAVMASQTQRHPGRRPARGFEIGSGEDPVSDAQGVSAASARGGADPPRAGRADPPAKDPRVGFITLTDVEITPDYAHAKVFFTNMTGGPMPEIQKACAARAASLRRELGCRRIRIHTIPELHFPLRPFRWKRACARRSWIDEVV